MDANFRSSHERFGQYGSVLRDLVDTADSAIYIHAWLLGFALQTHEGTSIAFAWLRKYLLLSRVPKGT